MSNPAYQITGNDIETSKGIRLILSQKVKENSWSWENSEFKFILEYGW